jgi:hypothetical protein
MAAPSVRVSRAGDTESLHRFDDGFGERPPSRHSYGALGSKATANDIVVKDINKRIRFGSTDPSKTHGKQF